MDRVAVRGKQAAGAPSHLPHHLTSFVGREAELRSLKRLLSTSRLVTLTGTGGAGKSRLASEVAAANSSLWPDGVWWIELAATDDVSGAVVASLELPGRGPAQDVVASWLAARKALLVLDNCEHLVADCAVFCQRMLERCSQLNIMATSREALGVAGEARWPVSSLRDPDALLLFEARARLVAPDFNMATRNLDAVTRICDRLDRLPLAIEMAAARIDVMSEQELLSNLNDRFRFLTSGTRTAPQRQQTMSAAIDWSHRLLSENESRLFRRLAVFQGGFTSASVQAVCADETDATLVDLLSGLVQKSMVVADRLDDGNTRFRLLESHHAFAADRLREAGELEPIHRRHYDYFMSSIGMAEQKWKVRESPNLWAALAWARLKVDDMGLALAIEVADSEFADHSRARALLLDLLEHSQPDGALRAKALNLAARLAMRQADHASARELADSSVAVAREVGDSELIAHALRGAGVVHHSVGELDTAAQMYEEALSHLQGSTSRRLAIEVKNQLGVLATERGQFQLGLDILMECLAFSRSEGDEQSTARFLESLANAQLGLGDVDAAAVTWNECLETFGELNDAFGTIWSIGGLALVAATRGDDERALRLQAVVIRLSREWSLSAWPLRIKQLDEACGRAAARLGARKSDAARKDGQAMSSARALEYALSDDSTQVDMPAEVGPLSRREREVVGLVAAGMTNREIGQRLFIAERTAEGHVERIRNKLGVRSRTEVATWAVEHGLAGQSLDKKPPGSSV